MRSAIISALFGAALCAQAFPAVAQDTLPVVGDPLSSVRAAALAGDRESVSAALQAIVANGDPVQLFEMARLLTSMPTEHILPSSDYPLAMALYRQVAERLEGQPGRDTRRLLQRAQYELAVVMLRMATRDSQLEEARALLETSAAAGYGRAAFRLGEGLVNGEIGRADPASGVLWLRRALNMGVGEAALALAAQLRAEGDSATLDEQQSLTRLGIAMLRSGALQGDVGQATDLALSYFDHPVIPRDLEQMNYWLQFAIDRGDPEAMVARADLLLAGELGTPDPEQARELLSAAAHAGSAAAALMLAETLLQQGNSPLAVDPGIAQAWLDRALAVNEPRAFRLAASLASERGDQAASLALLGRGAALGDIRAGIDLIVALVAAGEMDRASTTMEEMERRVAIMNTGSVALADLKLQGDTESPLHDTAGALSLLHAAAERGDGAALYRLGVLNSDGILIPQDQEVALRYFRQSAERGYFLADLKLSVAYAQGIGVEASPALAAEWLERARAAADLGPTDRMVSLGRALLDGQLGSDLTDEGLVWLRMASDRGSARAMVTLADSYLDGRAGVFDAERAFELYKSAVGAGDIDANYHVGRAYATGIGVSVDQRAAVEYFRLAAMAGNASAATELGLMLSSGGSVPADYEQAHDWLRRAADSGHVPAMIYMSNLIATGAFEGITDETAMSWLVRAAQTGDNDAQFQLAVALQRGLLGDVDPDGAEFWLRQAADNGHFQAQSELQRLLHNQDGRS